MRPRGTSRYVEIRDYLRLARRRWLLILTCLAAALGAAAFVTFHATPLYASTAEIFVSTPESDTTQAYQGGLFSQQRVTSYADIVDNRELANRVIEATHSDLSAEDLVSKVSATAIPETVLLEITVSDADPELAQQYAQSYAEETTAYIAELETPDNGKAPPISTKIAEKADLPTSPYTPNPERNLGLAAMLGLLIGIGLAILREMLDTSIKSAEDVTAISQTPVMATIATDPQAERHPLITDIGTHAPRAEAFRVLRTNLQFVDVDNPSKVFAVTSAVPGEGKTSTSINLAIALAQAGHRALLINGDLRRPRLEERLGLESAVGLTSVLVGRIDAPSAVQSHERSGLDVLGSGPIPPNPAELLQSHAMSELLKNLRDEYDMILIDAPPLLPVTDAALLAAHADGALIIARHGRTTRDQLHACLERLHAVDAQAVGVVINMVPTRRLGRAGYGYGYGYGYEPKGGRRSPRPSSTSDHRWKLRRERTEEH